LESYHRHREYKVELQKRIAQKQKEEEERIEKQLDKIKEDILKHRGQQPVTSVSRDPKQKRQTIILEDIQPHYPQSKRNKENIRNVENDSDDDDDQRLDVPNTRMF
jgi:hypothetical protein